MQALGPEVLADPLHPVRVDRPTGVDRTLRVRTHHLDGRVLLLEILADPTDRAPGADTGDEVGHAAAALPPQLPPGRSAPSRSAASIIASEGRSLTEPPGLRNSTLATSEVRRSGSRRERRTSGVSPINSSADSRISGPPS